MADPVLHPGVFAVPQFESAELAANQAVAGDSDERGDPQPVGVGKPEWGHSLRGISRVSCSSRPARWPRRPRRRHGCRRTIRSPVTSRRWCLGFPSRPACYRMVDSDGGIDIHLQPLTGTGGRTRGPRAGPSVRAGSPDTGQRAASTNRQIVVDEAAAPKTRFRSPPRLCPTPARPRLVSANTADLC